MADQKVPVLPPELQPKSDKTREVPVIDRDFVFGDGSLKQLTLTPELMDTEYDHGDYIEFTQWNSDHTSTIVTRVWKRSLTWDETYSHTITVEADTEIQSPAAVARQELSSSPSNESPSPQDPPASE